jgi:hypothetical protein
MRPKALLDQRFAASPMLHRIFTCHSLRPEQVRSRMPIESPMAFVENDMKSKFAKMTAALSLILAGAFLATTAAAQCASIPSLKSGAKVHPQSWNGGEPGAKLILASDATDPLTGFWQVAFTSEGTTGITDGTVIDRALVQFHSDGTEIMNSSRNPETQSFCLGVWSSLGNSKYAVNHIPISWDQTASTTQPLGLANIRETITLHPNGTQFSGRFTLIQYDGSGNVLATVTGTLAARRITTSTPITQIFQ